jgi:predicted O-methyltransferase YrrM
MRNQDFSLRDQYIQSLTPAEGEQKLSSRQAAEELGLARISVSAAEAQLIKTLIALQGGKKFVEIGTLTGLSAQYIFEALPEDAELWTLEKDPNHYEKARNIFSKINSSSKKLNLLEGDARDVLLTLSASGPFDGVFIDGNKAAYYDYLIWSEQNLKQGGLILADNVFLSGAVWGERTQQKFSEKQIRVMRDFNVRLMDPGLYLSAFIPTTEGLLLAIKK